MLLAGNRKRREREGSQIQWHEKGRERKRRRNLLSGALIYSLAIIIIVTRRENTQLKAKIEGEKQVTREKKRDNNTRKDVFMSLPSAFLLSPHREHESQQEYFGINMFVSPFYSPPSSILLLSSPFGSKDTALNVIHVCNQVC